MFVQLENTGLIQGLVQLPYFATQYVNQNLVLFERSLEMLKTTIVYQRSPMLEINLASNPGFDFMKVNFSVWLALSGFLNLHQLIL